VECGGDMVENVRPRDATGEFVWRLPRRRPAYPGRGLVGGPAPGGPLPVQEAFTSPQVVAAITLGVVSLMMSGLMPLFLGALADARRLSAAGIGQLATLELLSAAAATGLSGAVLEPRQLRLIGVLASLLLAGANLATLGAGGPLLMAVRALAGLPEGVLLWLVVGLIARSATPERRAGVLFAAMATSQLVVAWALTLLVLPRSGVDGGYLLIAVISLLGVAAALALPSAYGPLPSGVQAGPPPRKGWLALLAVFIFQAAIAGAGMYIIPLALQAGLGDNVARVAITLALALEVAGGLLATVIAGRANFLDVLLFSGLTLLAALAIYAVKAPAWLFIGASAAIGFCALLVMPFMVPMAIRADPSRRAAVQLGGAQLLGGAVGPVLASLVVAPHDAHGSLVLSAVLLVASLGLVFWLNRSARVGEPISGS
jgi:hypothetical protein